jgi:hypothetical protein
VQKHTAHVFHAHLLHETGWENSGCESAAKYICELIIQTTDSQFAEIKVWSKDLGTRAASECERVRAA